MKWVWHHKRTVLSYVAAWVLVSVSLAVVLAALRASSTPIEVIVDSGKPRRPYFTQTQAAIQDVSQVIRALTVSVQNNGSPAEDVVSHC